MTPRVQRLKLETQGPGVEVLGSYEIGLTGKLVVSSR